ncbi:GL23000 [Drosophila persimilis]|uniref:GL23000 n=1 Tax=Drosophila persimilis TaxID=7234 RepID=B4G4I7_DROPE|nr:uncharacterized protein LOC6588547 [Drosophila persimilis]EDW25158.1 GL23000 [Drosophila persimilis]
MDSLKKQHTASVQAKKQQQKLQLKLQLVKVAKTESLKEQPWPSGQQPLALHPTASSPAATNFGDNGYEVILEVNDSWVYLIQCPGLLLRHLRPRATISQRRLLRRQSVGGGN